MRPKTSAFHTRGSLLPLARIVRTHPFLPGTSASGSFSSPSPPARGRVIICLLPVSNLHRSFWMTCEREGEKSGFLRKQFARADSPLVTRARRFHLHQKFSAAGRMSNSCTHVSRG